MHKIYFLGKGLRENEKCGNESVSV